MWIPKTEKELIEAVESGSLEETVIFDAKRELPPKNKNVDIAEDIGLIRQVRTWSDVAHRS
jgi:hypothetical protein